MRVVIVEARKGLDAAIETIDSVPESDINDTLIRAAIASLSEALREAAK